MAAEMPTTDVPAEHRVVPIPGARGCGKGDAASPRCLRLEAGQHFRGAHTENQSYFQRTEHTLHLRSVCWLAVGCTAPQVPPGAWECVLRIRVNPRPDYNADWRIGANPVRHVRNFSRTEVDNTHDAHWQQEKERSGVAPLVLRNQHGNGKGGALLRSIGGEVTSLSFGAILLKEPTDVRFEMGGGNSHWCRGISFYYLELRPISLDLETKWLLFLMRSGHAGRECRLANTLPAEVLKYMETFLSGWSEDYKSISAADENAAGGGRRADGTSGDA